MKLLTRSQIGVLRNGRRGWNSNGLSNRRHFWNQVYALQVLNSHVSNLDMLHSSLSRSNHGRRYTSKPPQEPEVEQKPSNTPTQMRRMSNWRIRVQGIRINAGI